MIQITRRVERPSQWIAGTAFWGFTVSMFIGGQICDAIGMRRLVQAAFAGHVAGIALTIFAGGFWTLYAGTLFIGLVFPQARS